VRGPSRATWAARAFKVVILAGCALLWESVSHPWLTINGLTYTFLDVDSWKVLPVAELVVVAGGGLAAVVASKHVKRIGLVIGFSALTLNVVGAVVAARLADIHNSDQYFRLQAIMTIRPDWGGWAALGTCVVLIVGSASRWSARVSAPRADRAFDGGTEFEGRVGHHAHVPLTMSDVADEAESRSYGLPHLDDVLAPPKPRQGAEPLGPWTHSTRR